MRNNNLGQEQIRERELIPLIGLLSKVIPVKLILHVVPSSSAEITCAMRR